MFGYDPQRSVLIGPCGTLQIPPGDQASLKMAMILQGECTEIGPTQAAKLFQYSKSRYYQIRDTFIQKGVEWNCVMSVASRATSDSCFATRYPATLLASGCSLQSIYAWERGTCFVAGPAKNPAVSSPELPYLPIL